MSERYAITNAGRNTMVSTTASIVIRRPVEDVFEYITDPAHTPSWHADILDDSGRRGMPSGSTGSLRMLVFGKQTVSDYEITENNRRNRLRSRSTRGPLKFETVMMLTAEGDGSCRLTIVTSVDAGSIFRLAESALQSILGSHIDNDLARLKLILEAVKA